ncbi:MAG: hypothetical protein IJ588_13040 [Prevotella sp.]|nr:hypothetical protein [Prevotella sp.]
MKIRNYLVAIALLMVSEVSASEPGGKKPQWLSKGETYLNSQRSNDTYYFKIIQNVGSDLTALRQGNTAALADYIGKRNQVQGLEMTEMSNMQSQGGGVRTQENYQMVFKNSFSTDVFYATLVDQYWERVESSFGSLYQYYALYAVSTSSGSQPVFDRFEVSRSYGAAPVLMSVIPGAGQLYKGQKVKGFVMMGGAVVGAASIIYTSNRRAYYETRIAEQPKFAREYSKKRDDFTTWRNIAIGATGALVVWSVLDAAMTPGATRIEVSPSTSLTIRPTVMNTPDAVGFGTTLAFDF